MGDKVLISKWCEFYSQELMKQTRMTMKTCTPTLDRWSLFLPSRIENRVDPDLLEIGLKFAEEDEEDDNVDDGYEDEKSYDDEEDDDQDDYDKEEDDDGDDYDQEEEEEEEEDGYEYDDEYC